jgi:hypothetical protein
MRTADQDCGGTCRCPKCGAPAYWSDAERLHACVDPRCATQFCEHDPHALARVSPEDRYRRDPMFRSLVDMVEHLIEQAQYTPTELREAVTLACIRYESRRRPEPFYIPST